MRTTSIPIAGLAALALALAGCGGSDNSSSSSSGSSGSGGSSNAGGGYGATKTSSSGGASAGAVKLSADPNGGLKFTKTKLTAKAGSVTLDMTNPSSSGVPHGVAVEGNGVDKDGNIAKPGGSSKVTVKLKPGTYEFYCPVPGHKEAGMKGTLVVS